MIKGVQAWTVRDFLGNEEQLRETYRKIAEIGYKSVQAGAPQFMSTQEFQDLLQENGLVNTSSYSDFGRLKTDKDEMKRAVANARIYNTRYIGLGTIPDEYRNTLDGFKRFAKEMNEIAAELKKEGYGLLYHHHALEFLSFGGGLNGMDILTDETDPDGVFWTLDTHWLASGGVDLVYWINKLKNRMPIIHFKDYGIGTGTELIEGVCKTFAEVGEGNINWPPVIEACRNAGIEHAIVEQDSCPGNPFDSLRISFENMVKFNV